MISKFVLLIWVEGGNVVIFVNMSGNIEIVFKKIVLINVKWYKILVIYCLVVLLGWILGIYLFCFFKFLVICLGFIWINV